MDWINKEPEEFELANNPDGSTYMPIEFVKAKLYQLDAYWGTSNFNLIQFFAPDGSLWFSGSVELMVNYYRMDLPLKESKVSPEDNFYTLAPDKCKRVIVGCSTFDTQKYYNHPDNTGNSNWGQVCLSLCISAAAKELGPAFGKNLNKGLEKFLDTAPPSPRNNKIKNTLDSLTKEIKKK
jgi:hypothetical protein